MTFLFTDVETPRWLGRTPGDNGHEISSKPLCQAQASRARSSNQVAHSGTYALAERVDEGAHIAGYALAGMQTETAHIAGYGRPRFLSHDRALGAFYRVGGLWRAIASGHRCRCIHEPRLRHALTALFGTDLGKEMTAGSQPPWRSLANTRPGWRPAPHCDQRCICVRTVAVSGLTKVNVGVPSSRGQDGLSQKRLAMGPGRALGSTADTPLRSCLG